MKKYLKEIVGSIVGGIVLTYVVALFVQWWQIQQIDEMILGSCGAGMGYPLVWETQCPFPPFEALSYGALIGDVVIYSIVIYVIISVYKKIKKS